MSKRKRKEALAGAGVVDPVRVTTSEDRREWLHLARRATKVPNLRAVNDKKAARGGPARWTREY